MEYFAILGIFFVWAAVMTWRYRIRVYRSWRQGLLVTGVIFAIAIAWDYFAVWRGHWSFPGNGTVGLTVGPLPIEEFAFILIMPYWTLTMYYVLTRRRN